MRSKLTQFCDRVLEAGWLIALVVAPLFFNVYSDRVFEPDKLSIIRSLALVMIAAWLTRVIDRSLAPANAGESAGRRGLWDQVRSTPLVLPTLLMVLAYIISTVFSVVPRVSLWGSYQRLQGTYTTFSYIVIFFMVLSTLRRREQLDRLLNVIIITSLPIAIYGILQHFHRDPLPWGGDVTLRVASNMGNAIFVAAYLIMAVFVTLERLIRSFVILLDEARGDIAHAVLTGAYLAVLVAQLLCIFFTQSRGPWLGLAAGLYVFVLLGLVHLRRRAPDQAPLRASELARAAGLAVISLPVGGLPVLAVLAVLKKGLRWLWLAWVVQAAFGVLFLVLMNVPATPLAPLREVPYIGRLGQIFEGPTSRVRVLIWQGDVDLLKSNALRAIVGYGPESMYVAYNPFYPNDLAHYEARNASPDRSHNETFDALVTTGLIGFLAYIFLFSSAFYFGLKWLGLIRGPAERNRFIALGLAGALLGVIVPWIIEGSPKLAGVGLPAGFVFGIIVYITLSAASARDGEEETGTGRQLLLIALLSMIMAHFVEIHFGIGIAATRIHFWVLAATLVLVGLNRVPVEEEKEPAPAVVAQESRGKKPKKAPAAVPASAWERSASTTAFSLLVGLVLTICSYDYITNQARETGTLSIIWHALTRIVKGPTQSDLSFGILGLFVLIWLVGGLVTLAGAAANRPRDGQATPWWRAGIIYAVATIVVPLPFVLWHASRLRPYGGNAANNIVVPYTAILVFLLALAAVLLAEGRRPAPATSPVPMSWMAAGSGLALTAGAIALLLITNVTPIQADSYYKQGKTAENYQQGDAAIAYHQKAVELAPQQDFYYLFLGRAQLEQAQSITDATQRDAGINRALQTLIVAQRLNPLNTDHTANLGRLYRIWAQSTDDATKRSELFAKSLEYYAQALRLSPHNAGLMNEWGLVYYYMGQYDEALKKYAESMTLDKSYDQTYMLTGDVYLAQRQFEPAVELYNQALALTPDLAQAHSALGYAYAQLGRNGDAIQENLTVLQTSPQDYISLRNLALLYQQTGQYTVALQTAEQALPNAPEQEKAPLQQLIDQLRTQAGK